MPARQDRQARFLARHAAPRGRSWASTRPTPNDLTPEERARFAVLDIDPAGITWNRVIDISDRFLRKIEIGLGPDEKGHTRITGYDITVASELMAILALTTGLEDLRERIGRVVIGTSKAGEAVTVEDLGVAGAATVLMKDAIMPNLMQTLEGQPAFVHAGPFANIAHGNSSIIADQIALKLADYVVTESGFGARHGHGEVHGHQVPLLGLDPQLRGAGGDGARAEDARRRAEGGGRQAAGPSPTPSENLPLLEKGCANLVAHIENVKRYGVPVVVADQPVQGRHAGRDRADPREGGRGGRRGCGAVARTGPTAATARSSWPRRSSRRARSRATSSSSTRWSGASRRRSRRSPMDIYGAGSVSYTPEAEAKIELYTRLGFDKLPICMAKTHLSLSHDPAVKGRPQGYVFPVRDIRASVGAGFLYPLCGEMRTMPGLPTRPVFYDVDLDLETGRVVGLF